MTRMSFLFQQIKLHMEKLYMKEPCEQCERPKNKFSVSVPSSSVWQKTENIVQSLQTFSEGFGSKQMQTFQWNIAHKITT